MIHINTYDTEGSLELENAARMGEAMLAQGERYDYAADEVARRFYMLRSGAFLFWHAALPEVARPVFPWTGEGAVPVGVRLCGRAEWAIVRIDDSIGPFPAEPAFGSPEAVAQARERVLDHASGRARRESAPMAVFERIVDGVPEHATLHASSVHLFPEVDGWARIATVEQRIELLDDQQGEEETGMLCDDLEGAVEDATLPLPDLYNGDPVAVAYPHEAVLPAPSGGQERQYRYRVVEKPQGGQRVEAIFLTAHNGEPRWRAVRREETLEALEALPLASHAAMADRIIPTLTGGAYFWHPALPEVRYGGQGALVARNPRTSAFRLLTVGSPAAVSRAQPKRPSKRTVALTLARVAGFEGDTRTFTRLIVESRVNREAMHEAWRAGVEQRKAAESWPAYGKGRGPAYVEPTPDGLEQAYRAGRQAIRDFEEEHGEQSSAGAPAPGWNFGHGTSGVIE